MTIQIPKLPLNPQEQALHESALKAAGLFHGAQFGLLEIVDEVDICRLFVKLGQKSTFAYCVNVLGLSEDMTCNLTVVARKSHEVPELKQAVHDGLSIAKARKIASVINHENQSHWIGLARSLSHAQLEREIARNFPEQAVRERVTPVSGERQKIVLGMNNDDYELLLEVQNLVSSKEGIAATLEQTLVEALKEYSNRHDPVKKAERRRKDLPKHEVNERDAHRCQAENENGEICGQARWLHVHHIRPRSEGGTDDPENLITLCSFHHHLLHRVRDGEFIRRATDTGPGRGVSLPASGSASALLSGSPPGPPGLLPASPETLLP